MIPRLFVQDTLAQGARLAADPRAAHYLLNVLRRGEGDRLRLFNGRDGEFEARIDDAGKRRLVLEVLARRRAQEEDGDLWLCFAPLKKDAVDFLIEKGTELGVGRFLPVLTAHTTNRSVNQTRLTSVATEAAEQSERLTVPEIAEPTTLEALRTSWPNGRRLLVCAEAGLATPIAEALQDLRRQDPRPQGLTADVSISNRYGILCGPEGGFQQDELDRLRKLDFVTPVGLGPRVLRAETAALAALAAFQAILGDGAKRPPQPG
ncbi:MAG TPA: 16S rRNA (uracil(1498)-N(3))-methyltransferase [Dongiaceae bacterium]|nr:16S rRNA (uracil(1498)-N(3))-methyltransferase [Dongiaceae bacterium]